MLSSAGNWFGSLDKTLHLSGFRFPRLSKGEKPPCSCPILSLGPGMLMGEFPEMRQFFRGGLERGSLGEGR